MSTPANTPGEPGRGDDATDPAEQPVDSGAVEGGSDVPTGDQDAAGAAGSADAAPEDSVTGDSATEDSATGDSATGDSATGDSVTEGGDVTKKIRSEARASEAAVRRSARSGKPQQSKAPEKKSRASTGTSRTSAVPGQEGRDLGLFARIALFVRQVFAEIRKVVTPSRQELLTYSVVVIVFILAMMAYVGALDFAIGRLVLWVFGN